MIAWPSSGPRTRPARSAGRTRRSASTSTTPKRSDGFEFMGFPYTPGEQAGYPAVIQQVVRLPRRDPRTPPSSWASRPRTAPRSSRACGPPERKAQVYTSNSCDDESVRGLPESAGTEFETPGFIVEQPELYSEFTQFMLAEREAALDAYGPQSPRGSFMRSMFSAVLFVYQVAERGIGGRRRHRRPGGVPRGDRHGRGLLPARLPAGVVRRERQRVRVDLPAQDQLLGVGRRGRTRPTPDITDGYIDVTDLLLAVEEASPRQ